MSDPQHLESALVTIRQRRQAIREDDANMVLALRAAVRDAINAGMSEVKAAKLAGVSRPTVRKWLGK